MWPQAYEILMLLAYDLFPVALTLLPIVGYVRMENRCVLRPATVAPYYQKQARYLQSHGPWILFGMLLASLYLLETRPVSLAWYTLAGGELPVAYIIGRDLALQALGPAACRQPASSERPCL